MDRPQGYLLSGGQSRRFGRDKARQPIGSRTLIEQLQLRLNEWTTPVQIVADRADKYADLEITALTDRIPGQGPLGGIHAALVDARDRTELPWVVVISCDMTELNPRWLDELWQAAISSPDSKVVLFQESADRRHPFPACYHVSLIETIESQFAAGRRSCQALFEAIGDQLRTLPLPADWPDVPQFNTPEEFAAWQQRKPS
ncbi:molybdenum cofactor guanylyltransferase [Rubinisphaera margarita]|uniref:molybdenum cofactor guanylyltransferase n=1 Tax=Rubinisphaera margarita TaxID=2909586 RepID=UPI001EE8C6F2|nr:molybdenum cofactor guanylyltransferase [Rubinisphaera margarita]MCG6158397.1 molybdenum cofactor guanylyltransferase [Rubinisphaera margarita]